MSGPGQQGQGEHTDPGRHDGPDVAGGPDKTEPGEIAPDPRFTLANQRTFLAWSRTSLALIAAGLAIVQLLKPFPGVPAGRHVIGVPLIVLGAGMAAQSYREWIATQAALRHGDPLPRSLLPLVLAATIALAAVAAAVVVLLSVTR